jgi:hypothetical protein
MADESPESQETQVAGTEDATSPEAPPWGDVAGGSERGDQAAGESAGGQSPLEVGSSTDAFGERPELFVGAAFLGGFAIAQILKRFGSE